MSKKTIIQVWKQECFNMPKTHFWGFADLLRGTVATYQICRKLDIKYKVIIDYHPISKYFEKNDIDEEITKKIEENLDMIPFIDNGKDIENYINEKIKENDIILLLTNCFTKYTIENDDILMLHQYFKPNLILENLILKYKPNINYSILHIRFGDIYLLENNTNENLFNKIKENYFKINTNIVLITDCNSFKIFLKNNLNVTSNIIIPDTIPTHIGISDECLGTLIDFYLMKYCDKIISLFYKYGSGFGLWGHYMFHKEYRIEEIK